MLTATLAKRTLVEPTYWTCPHGARVRPSLTYGPAVAEICDKAGYTPDPQQELGLDIVFAIRPDGSPSCFSFCVICARQNLKSGLFQQCVIGWLFVTEVPEVAWSAHELRTSLNAQRELYQTLEHPTLSKYLPASGNKGLYDTNGKERIELNTGQTVWFQTRTRDGGRGLGKPKVIIDEAFKFKARTAGALLPILLAQHHPQLLYGSSEPPIDEDSATLRDVMDRGQNHKSPELGFLQWKAQREPCADPDCAHPKDALVRGIDCALDREHLIREANPTLTTGRITMRTLRALRQELDPVEYMRECLGWPDEPEADQEPPAVDVTQWSRRANRKTPKPSRVTVVLSVSPDRRTASIGVAGAGLDGKTLVMEHTASGTAWVVPKLTALLAKRSVREVALAPGQASVLVPALNEAGVVFEKLTAPQAHAATGEFLTAVEQNTLVHLAQDDLDKAVTNARTRIVGDYDTWDQRDRSGPPITAVVACSLALHRWTTKRVGKPMATFV